jgi:hypothetical protein
MGAVTDPDELAHAQAQISAGTTPRVPLGEAAATPGSGPIVDPDELAHARAQLAAPSAPGAPAPNAPALPQGETSMGPTPDRGIAGAIEDGVRMLVAPLMGNRVAAALDTATGTGLPNADYTKNLANEEAKTNWVQAQHPYASQILGGAGTLGAGAAALAAAPEEGVLGGATMGGRALYSALTGGSLSGANAASAEPDLTAPGAASRVGLSTLVGASGGGAAPLVGAGLGAAYNAGANAVTGGVEGMSRGAAKQLLPAMAADTPSAVLAKNAELGPTGMLVDTGPSLQGKGQGAALNSDEGRTILTNAVAARSHPDEISQRVAADVTNTLGQAKSAQVVSDALEAKKAPHNANLTQAFANAPSVDIQNVIDGIDNVKAADGTPLQSTLATIRKSLTQDMGPDADRAPLTDAETLDRARQAIDGMINWAPRGVGPLAGADASSQGIVGNIRTQLSQALKSQVPGYEPAMNGLAKINTLQENIANGLKSLRGGTASIDPEDFANQYGTLPQGPVQPGELPPRTPEQVATNFGMRSAINKALLSNPNDAVAIKRLLQGEEGGNSQNIGTAFGPDARTALQQVVDRENAFAGTNNAIVTNAETARRQAAAAAMKPEAATGGIPYLNPNTSVVGLFATPLRAIGTAALNQLRPDPTRAYGEIARVLTAQGPQRDAYTQALADALLNRGRNAAMAQTVGAAGSKAALAAALIGARQLNGPRPGPQQGQ